MNIYEESLKFHAELKEKLEVKQATIKSGANK